MSKEQALQDCKEYEQYYNQSDKKDKLSPPEGIEKYQKCTYCGNDYKNFKELSDEEQVYIPNGITICPILDPKND